MAIPANYSLTPYTPGYPVKTGRTRLIGGRADVTLHAHGAKGAYLIGTANISIEGWSGSIVPVITWADADSSWWFTNWSDWTTTTNIPDTSGRDSHAAGSSNNIQLAWLIEITEEVTSGGLTGTKTYCILQTIATGTWDGGFSMWRLPATISASSEWSAVTRFSAKELGEIAEDAANWPDNAREEGMRYLSAAFSDVAEESYTEGALKFNGADYTISPAFGGGDPLACGCQLGLGSTINNTGDAIWLWDPHDEMSSSAGSGVLYANTWDTGSYDYSKRLCAEGSIGSSEMMMYLPRLDDDSDFKTYSLWDRWDGSYASSDSGDYHCELKAKGKTLEWWACGKSNSATPGGTGGGRLIWTRYNWAYRLNLDVVYMDGTAIPGVEPEVLDHSTPVDGLNVGWTGSTGPIRSGGGHWKIEGASERVSGGSPIALIPNPPYPTFAARTADIDGNPNNNDSDAYNGYFERDEDWSNWHIGPFELTNPADFGLYSDQTRVLMRYPRSGHSLTIDPSSANIDGFTLADWTAHNCTIAVEGGGIKVTDVTAGAYITRTHNPAIHAPVQRYWVLTESCYDAGTADPATSNAQLVVSGVGYDGGGDPLSWSKRFVHRLRGQYWDTCRPEEAVGNDNEQSYIYQAQPEHEDGENSIISWGWGIGLFSEIRIANLETGKDYVFTSLDAVMLTVDKVADPLGADHQCALLVAREYSPLRLLGTKTALPEDDRYEVERILQCSVNGRIGFESGAIYQTTIHTGGVATVTRTNLPVQGIGDGTNRWPADDLTSVGVTDELPWSNSWFDAGLGTAGEYTDESVLFCAELAPAWFLVEGKVTDEEIDVRPVFDQISCGPHFGTGANVHTDAQPDCIELFATIYVGNRIHGVLWRDRETAEETEADYTFDFTVSNPAASLETSPVGSFFTSYQLSPSTVEFDTASQAVTTTRSNVWTRLCMFVAALAGGLRMRHGKYWSGGSLQPYKDVTLDTDI